MSARKRLPPERPSGPNRGHGAAVRGPAKKLGMAELGAAGRVVDDGPKLTPYSRSASLFVFMPERWQVLADEVVPLFGSFSFKGGVNNVKVLSDDGKTVSVVDAIAGKTKKGQTVLDPEIDGESYLHEPVPGVFLTRWETAHAGSSHISTDVVGFAKWCRKLVDDGILPPPRPYVLEALRVRYQAEVSDLNDRVRGTPSVQHELERAQKRLEVVEREIAAGAAEARPLPKRSVNPMRSASAPEREVDDTDDDADAE